MSSGYYVYLLQHYKTALCLQSILMFHESVAVKNGHFPKLHDSVSLYKRDPEYFALRNSCFND
jgi:hypothetical protein